MKPKPSTGSRYGLLPYSTRAGAACGLSSEHSERIETRNEWWSRYGLSPYSTHARYGLSPYSTRARSPSPRTGEGRQLSLNANRYIRR